MRYITILIVIVVYWFILGVGLNLLIQDNFIIAEALEGNTSYNLINTSEINSSLSIYDNEDYNDRSLKTFPTMLKVMFGFKSPIPQGIPTIMVVFLSFLNWFALIFFGIALYRIINPLA